MLATMNPLTKFDRFLLSQFERIEMRSEFEPVLTNATFARDKSLSLLRDTHTGVSGIYFWILRNKDIEYKLYIGKTKSLANRLVNYVSEFQPHSPNDYKLRIFAQYLVELAPEAALDLYFEATDVGDLKDAEKKAIRRFRPILNQLPSPSSDAKEKLKNAFENFYRSTFDFQP